MDNILIIKESIFIILLIIGNGLTISAFSMLDKEGIFLFAPGMLILTCTLCVTGVLALIRRTSNLTIRGAFIGLLLGGIIGALGIFEPIFFFLAYKAEGGIGATGEAPGISGSLLRCAGAGHGGGSASPGK